MAVKIGTGYIALKADVDSLRKDLEQVKKETTSAARDVESRMANATDGISRAFTTMKRVAVAAFAGWGIKNIAESFLDVGKASEGLKTRLQILMGSQEKGNELWREMTEYAGKVPFEFAEVMQAATSLAGVMKGGTEEIKTWMPMIGDLAAATGLSIQETTGQVIRMYSSGAASADMFRERGVLAMMGFQSGVAYSAEETRRMMMESWQAAGSQFKGATDLMADDWSGIMSMMADDWQAFRQAVMDAGVFDFLKAGLQEIRNEISELRASETFGQTVQSWADRTVDAFGVMIKAGAAVGDSVRGIGIMFQGVRNVVSWIAQDVLETQIQIVKFRDWINTSLGFEGYADVIADMEKRQAGWVQSMNESKAALEKLWGDTTYWDKADLMIARMKNSAADMALAAQGALTGIRRDAVGAVVEVASAAGAAADEAGDALEEIGSTHGHMVYEVGQESDDMAGRLSGDYKRIGAAGMSAFDAIGGAATNAADEAISAWAKYESFKTTISTGLPTGKASEFTVYGPRTQGQPGSGAWNPGDIIHRPYFTTGFHRGGMITAHDGLFLRPDERIIKAQTGEGILSRAGVRAAGGESGVSTLNKGGGAVRAMNLNISGVITTDEVQKWAADMVEKITVGRRGIALQRSTLQTVGIANI